MSDYSAEEARERYRGQAGILPQLQAQPKAEADKAMKKLGDLPDGALTAPPARPATSGQGRYKSPVQAKPAEQPRAVPAKPATRPSATGKPLSPFWKGVWDTRDRLLGK